MAKNETMYVIVEDTQFQEAMTRVSETIKRIKKEYNELPWFIKITVPISILLKRFFYDTHAS